jgi:hypothetical protein
MIYMKKNLDRVVPEEIEPVAGPEDGPEAEPELWPEAGPEVGPEAGPRTWTSSWRIRSPGLKKEKNLERYRYTEKKENFPHI